MIFDCHTHTKFSADSEMLAKDAIAKAESLGFGIIFTEHFDYDLPGDIDFTFKPEEYFAEYEKLRGENVRLGVEVGFRDTARQINKNFIASADFDMVIGSVHLVDDLDIYYPEYFADKTKTVAYKRYFETMIASAAVEDFDVLGHIDYICRKSPYEKPAIDYETFHADIDEVLKIIIEREKVLELNTRRLDKKSVVDELLPIYRRYKELGGKFITIGSDAHNVGAVGNYFDTASDMVNELNLIPVTFRNRKIEF